MGGKLAVFTLAFVFSSLGLKAQNEYGVSLDDWTYTGSNGCSSFGVCDSNGSTVTDSSGTQSSGWKFDGNSWQVVFTPGQLQTLGPSWTDQMNALQTRIQQAVQDLTVQEVVHDALELGENGLEIAERSADEVDPDALILNPYVLILKGLAMGTTPGLEVGTTYLQPAPVFDPALDSPLSRQSGGANPSSISQTSGPFTTVDPGSVTIVDPPFTGDPSTIIDPNSGVDASKATIVDPPATGGPSTVIDLNTNAEAQQMLLQAKQSQQSLVSEQQQLQSQASQYQSQSQQAIQQSEIQVQAATNYALSNAAGNIGQRNVQSGNTVSSGNALQSFGQALNSLSKVGQSSQPSKGPTVPAAQPSSEESAVAQLVNELKAPGVIQTPATQSATPAVSLGPTGVTCQTVGPKKVLQCTGTLPSYMTTPK